MFISSKDVSQVMFSKNFHFCGSFVSFSFWRNTVGMCFNVLSAEEICGLGLYFGVHISGSEKFCAAVLLLPLKNSCRIAAFAKEIFH